MIAPDFDILVIGEINADLILTGDVTPAFGQAEKVIDDATLTIGSSGVIFACGAARLGLRTAYAGLVGDDMFGRFMLEQMQQRQVDTSGVVVDPGVKTGLSVILSQGDDRAILTHMGGISGLHAEQVNSSLLRRARHVHVTSYFLQHALRPGLPALLATAQQAGLTVSLDTNWDPNEKWDDGLDAVLRQVDVFLPNEQEARAIDLRQSQGSAHPPNLAATLERLARIVPTVAVKRGRHGAVGQHGQAVVWEPGFPLEAVDTTGAGDSFNAGFLYGHLHGWTLECSLALACACGALSTRAVGGTDAQPSLAEAQALLETRGTPCFH